MKRKTIKRKNLFLAIVYVILGLSIAGTMAFFGGLLYCSGDFLVGTDPTHLNWWIRKILYFILLFVLLGGFALANYGSEYLSKRWKRFRNKKR